MAVLEALDTNGSERRRFLVKSPGTLEPLGEFEVTSADEVEAAVERARLAQQRWAAKSFAERAAVMRTALKILVDQQEDYIDVICRDTGRSRMETTFFEILPACDSLEFYAKRAKKMLSERGVGLHLLRMKKCRIVYQPLGVVGVITPWNGPFIMGVNPTVQALMAGNAVIVKPSEVTPFAGRLVADLFEAAGLPEGLLQVLLGDGSTGAALVESGVDKISFTGSVATGRRVGEACARNLISCTLELGGKDAMVVCSDADMERTTSGALFGAFANSGQFCCSTERVYVVDSIADEFISKVVEKTKALKQGTEGEFDVGAIIHADQINIIERHVKDAVKKGARVLTGGKRHDGLGGHFWEPTVLVDVTHEMEIMTEETFGPVLPIMRVADESEAILMANDCVYGLSGTVWTKDKAKGLRLAKQMDTGSVCVNDSAITYGAHEVPFGGRKFSGVGYVNSQLGLRSYCYPKPVIVDRFGLKEEQVWFPYTKAKDTTLKKAIKAIWDSPLRRILG